MEKKKVKDDGKGKYRKKPYTQKFSRDFRQEIKDYVAERNAIKDRCFPEGVPHQGLKNIVDLVGRRSAISAQNVKGENIQKLNNYVFLVSQLGLKYSDIALLFQFGQDSLLEPLIDLGCKGANIRLLLGNLSAGINFESGSLQGCWLPDYNLGRGYNEAVNRLNEYKKEFSRSTKRIKTNFRFLFNEIVPISEDFCKLYPGIAEINQERLRLQENLKIFIDKYIEATEAILIQVKGDWKTRHKTVSGKSGKLTNKMVAIVGELIRIGYSTKSAYKATAKLLNLAYPHLYQDTDPDLVKQRHTYAIKNPRKAKE